MGFYMLELLNYTEALLHSTHFHSNLYRDFESTWSVEWEGNQLEGGQRPPYCDIQAGMTLVIAAVRSSKPVPADAKLTPVFTSSFDSLGSKNGGTNSFIPNLEATMSGMSFPSLNLPVLTWPGKSLPYGK